MIHRAEADFWIDYRALPASIRALADKQFAPYVVPAKVRGERHISGRFDSKLLWLHVDSPACCDRSQ